MSVGCMAVTRLIEIQSEAVVEPETEWYGGNAMEMNSRARDILKTVFGFERFHPHQERVIQNVLSGRDTLAVMPTGGGKSLCYQVPALIFEGLTVVISPLISLMRDQTQQLSENGITAAVLNSGLSMEEYRFHTERVRDGRAKLLYLAPETLLKPNIIDLLQSVRISAVAVDEAHCISAWGHDFRPEYRNLVRIRNTFPGAVWLALTATATPRVREDILATLGFADENLILAGFDRPNLFIEITPRFEPEQQLIRFVSRFEDASGIVYCQARRTADHLARVLSEEGIPALPYHAGLGPETRNRHQRRFVMDEIRVITATVAFGMGIDKSDVRFIVHYDLPKDIESYYQEIGRAGRDGLSAHCRLMFDPADAVKIRHFFNEKSGAERVEAEKRLQALLDLAASRECRRVGLLGYFGETVSESDCGHCDICRKPESGGADLTVPAQKFLSCVYRTGQKFGAAHVAAVLMGGNTKKIRQFGHDRLSTYGIGTELDRRGWRILGLHLLQQGYLAQHSVHKYLTLTPASRAILRNEERFFAEMEIPDSTETSVDGSALETDYDRELFQSLRKMRKQLADEAGMPPFVIFGDRSLRDMALRFPQSMEGFARIHGVGQAKLEKYGGVFVPLIREYCEAKGIAENLNLPVAAAARKPAKTRDRSVRKQRCTDIGEGFKTGADIDDLAETHRIQPNTVLNHLKNYLLSGGSLPADRFRRLISLPESQCDAVLEFFRENGAEYLKPAFLHFEELISYDHLHLLRLLFYAEYGVPEVNGSQREKADTCRIVCLANSRKFGGRCVAGKRLNGDSVGEWVRPVSPKETGELNSRVIALQGGAMPALGDILSIPVDKPAPHPYQSENIFLKSETWQKVGEFSPDRLDALLDSPETLWQNGYSGWHGLNDRIPVEAFDSSGSGSLFFIHAREVSVHVVKGADGLKHIRAGFIYGGRKYRLAVTDAAVEESFIKQEFGVYPLADEYVYLCISLSEPCEGFCYKLAAGIWRLPNPIGRSLERDP